METIADDPAWTLFILSKKMIEKHKRACLVKETEAHVFIRLFLLFLLGLFLGFLTGTTSSGTTSRSSTTSRNGGELLLTLSKDL